FGCLITILWFFPGQAALQRQVDQANPVGAVSFIRQTHLSGPMLNEYAFGGYLIWTLPGTQVFIDGRADIYDPAGVMAEYMHWANLDQDPVLLLDRKHINFCLLYRGS